MPGAATRWPQARSAPEAPLAAGSIDPVSSQPATFITIDHGSATVAVALVARVGGRWRLLGATAAPSSVGADALVRRLRLRLDAADPDLARACGLVGPEADAGLPRLETRTVPPPTIVVVGATERVVRPLAEAAATAGWRVRAMAIEGANILQIASALADPAVKAVLAGASDPPGADERALLADLGALVVAATQRRPDLSAILSGALGAADGPTSRAMAPERPGPTLLAPPPASPAAGRDRLRELLGEIRGGTPDGRQVLARSAVTLADVLARRVEIVEIGQTAGARIAAAWSPDGAVPRVTSAIVPEAALVPPGADDTVVDAVAAWLPIPLDRLRLRDRLHDLGVTPWGDAAGDGAVLRMAAARAALARLVAATPAHEALPPADLVVASGGVWSVAPAPAVALALADVMRRPGIRGLGLDHARLLAPLGMIDDPDERRRVIHDLRDELLVPLGTVMMPAGLRPGRSAGSLGVRSDGDAVELELMPGGIELVDLPPGVQAVVEARFREPTDIGVRARHVAAEVAGGLGGLLVDMRDIPLRLPERPERRRELMRAWHAAMWAGLDG